MNRYGYGSTATLLIFLLVFFARTCARHQRELKRESVNYSYQAEEAYDKGDYKMALHYADQALKMKPDDAILLSNRALIYDKMGDRQNAIADAKRAAQIDSKDPDFRLLLASLYLDSNLMDDSIATLDEGLKAHPGHPLMLFLRGTVLLYNGKPDDAAASFKELAQPDGDTTLANLGLGMHAYFTGNFDEARQVLTSNMDTAGEHEDWYRELRARTNYHLGNYQEALADSDRAFSLDPTSGDAKAIHGYAQLMMSNTAGATDAFRQATGAEEDKESGFQGLAMMAISTGSLDEAAQNLDKAIALDADDFDLHHERAIVEILRGQPQPALQHVDTALQKVALNPPLYEMSTRRQAASAATARIEQVMTGQYGVSYMHMHYNRALIQLMLGDAEAAKTEFRLALLEQPPVPLTPNVEQILAAYDAGGKVSLSRQGWKFQVVLGN